jgi:AraC-like DNA-binding protein
MAIARELEKELADEQYGRLIVSTGLLLRLLIAIGRGFLQPSAARLEPTQPKDGKMLDILRYIDNHLCEDITIDLLAEKFYISKFHMMRRFREETGSSVHTYLSDRRLLLARDMIRNGTPATDACFHCGFRSYSSFSRAYGKLFGTTPTGRTGGSVPEESTYE